MYKKERKKGKAGRKKERERKRKRERKKEIGRKEGRKENMITFLHQVKTKKLVVMFSLPFPSIRVQNCISAAHAAFACVTRCSLIDTTDMSKSVFLARRS